MHDLLPFFCRRASCLPYSPTRMVDEALALHEARGFAARVQTADGQWRPSLAHLDDPAHKSLVEVIHKQLPLIRDIAREYDEELAGRIDHGINYGSGYGSALAATNELVGILESADRRAAIFEVKGPRLALSSMHPWIYGNAAQQWADGHHCEAVVSAASAIFDVYLPAKIQLPKGSDLEQMVAKAFGSTTNPFLKLPGARRADTTARTRIKVRSTSALPASSSSGICGPTTSPPPPMRTSCSRSWRCSVGLQGLSILRRSSRRHSRASPDKSRDRVCRLLVLTRQRVAVHIARDSHRGVPEALAHDDQRDVVRQAQRCVGVPQAVDADGGEPSGLR
jgi:hypothetical protein